MKPLENIENSVMIKEMQRELILYTEQFRNSPAHHTSPSRQIRRQPP